MKKIYSAMAIALAFGISASASVKDYANGPYTKTFSVSDFQKQYELKDDAAQSSKRVKQNEAATKNDALGFKMGFYLDLFSDADGLSSNSYRIVESEKPGYVSIYGFFEDVPVEAKLDEANGTLTIEKQFAFYNSYYKKDINFVPIRVNQEAKRFEEVQSITFTYDIQGLTFNDGSINLAPVWLADWRETLGVVYEFNEDGTFGGWMGRNNMFIADFNNYLSEFGYGVDKVFEYNASEWKAVNGTANFTDGFINPLLTEAIPAYPVAVEVNVANPNLILLKNPYGADTTWAQINEDTSSVGAIVFNVANPEMVKVYPFVYTGFGAAVSFENGYSEVYAMNAEGAFSYLDGYSDEDVEKAIKMYKMEPSTLDVDNNILTIPTAQHSMQYSLTTPGYWTFYDDNQEEYVKQQETIVELPVGAIGGVEGITDDVDMNAPKHFFNLQGVEVANPAAGEIVIVKQGGKTTKVVVK